MDKKVFEASETIEQMSEQLLDIYEKHKGFVQLLNKVLQYIDSVKDDFERDVLFAVAVDRLMHTGVTLRAKIAVLEQIKFKLLLEAQLHMDTLRILLLRSIRNRERFK